MSANDMNVKVVYLTGAMETITAPDLSVDEDFGFQSEFVDVTSPDDGVFWERSYVALSNADTVDSENEEEARRARNPWARLRQRTCVVPPENMDCVAAIFVGGVLALVRKPDATTSCGLENVLLDSMLGEDWMGPGAQRLPEVEVDPETGEPIEADAADGSAASFPDDEWHE